MPSQCGHKEQPVWHRNPFGTPIGTPKQKGDSVGTDSLTSYMEVPVSSEDYAGVSEGSTGVFIVMAALYLCFCFVRKYKRKKTVEC